VRSALAACGDTLSRVPTREMVSHTERMVNRDRRVTQRGRESAQDTRAARSRRTLWRWGVRHQADVGTCHAVPVVGEVSPPGASANAGHCDASRLPSPAVLGVLAVLSCPDPDAAQMPVVLVADRSLSVVSPTESPLWEVRDVSDIHGTIWALTASAPFVHAFSPSGKLTSRFGRSGEGPGDLRFPHTVWPGRPNGGLTVWDQGFSAALTFSSRGNLLSSLRAPNPGAIRDDIATVTFGHPFRAVGVPGGFVAARYDSGVNHPDDLWNGSLFLVPDDGGDPHMLIDFALELPGASMRSLAALLVPVPLWDGCPDGRIAVLDPITRTLFLLDPADPSPEARESITLPWSSPPLNRDVRLEYLTSRVRAEAGDNGLSDAEILSAATEAEKRAEPVFPDEAPIGVDLKCAPGRVWIQEFDGSAHPLGYGRSWRTATLDRSPATFSRVVFPADFQPHRISASRALGVVADPAGHHHVATVLLESTARQGQPPNTPSTSTDPTVAQSQGEHH